ncbi:DUF1302 domain-containing protein [Pseudomonas sp. N040]|uniref:DUF1302 domain-containing protein n=1 Tax=Pseudomonas sp. N040 TaxID=2785325 RepID=UPI0018A29691|nr:DUF1302 domain-containing protein [Pseudomonas sp. N040]MBF7729110.1 DUF1302 domain-containing protein [Pseudomonas sp. N040]MBW7012750.1 DUF1302 domain-containing protein [Pseudomonas sp. N040]
MKKNKSQTVNLRRGLLASAVLAGMGLSSAQALELDTGNSDFAVRFDNTIKYNYGVRTESADKTMLATPNSNDGDYNFRKAGTNITNRVDLLTELDVVYKQNMGFRVSAASWYDKAYANTGSNSNPFVNGNDSATGLVAPHPVNAAVTADDIGYGSSHLSNYAQRYYSGPSGEILDAFVFYSTEVGEESLLSAKAGQHNIFWGETLLNPVHSVSYGQSGLDLAKLAASPGTEAKELFVPRNQFSTSFIVNSELTLAGQYFFDWDAARLAEAGTYYGANDSVGFGAKSNLLGSTNLNPLTGQATPGTVGCGLLPCAAQLSVRRGDDITPDDSGDFGLMAKWSPEWLDGTLGVYYRKTSDILPQAVLDGNSLAAPTPLPVANLLNSTANASYSFAYAEDIDIYGLSLSKNIEGVSVGSDLNIRHNMPLASIAMVVSPGLAAGFPSIALPARTPETGVVTAVPGHSYSATGDTLHWTLNGLTTFADTPLFDSAVLLGELYYSNLLSMNNTNSALYKGNDSYRGIDKADRDNVGVAVNFTPTWYQVSPGVDMTMPMAINVGIDGNSPVSGGGAKDTGNYSLGVGAQIYNQYFVDLKYVDSFGKTNKCKTSGYGTVAGSGDGAAPGAFSNAENYSCYAGGYSSFSGPGAALEDRGAVYLTLKTTF